MYIKIKKWYRNLKLRNKIFLLCGIMVALSLAVNMSLYSNALYKTAVSEMNEASNKTLLSMQTAIKTKINAVNHASRLVMNENVLDIVSEGDSNYENIAALDKLLRPVIDNFPFIQSVCIYGVSGFEYSLFKNTDYLYPKMDVMSASWYDTVIGKNGYYILSYNSGGFYENSNEELSYISLIRSINSTLTQKQIGVLIINVGIEYFYEGIISAEINREAFSIFDETGKEMIKSGDAANMGISLPDFLDDLDSSPDNSYFTTKKSGNNEFLISGRYLPEYSWSIFTVNSLNSVFAAFKWLYSFYYIR